MNSPTSLLSRVLASRSAPAEAAMSSVEALCSSAAAETSSLDARDIEAFERDDERWVRFRLEGDRQGEAASQWVERPVLRRVKVRGAGGVDHRYVIRLQLCIGHQAYEEQFTLRDRSRMAYPALLGRRTLEHLGLVDVRRQHLQQPEC